MKRPIAASRKTFAFAIRVAFLVLCSVLMPMVAQAQVVISQIYGGGQGGAAVYKNDYVELFNPTSSPISLANWTVQYQASGSTGNFTGKVTLTGTIEASKYFLVQMSANTGSGAGALDLPTPDVTSTAVSMSATAGKVALTNSTATLVTTAGPPVVCPFSGAVIDLIGYGAANCGEGTTTPALTTTTAAFRNSGGCTDTNNNSADFTTGAPLPRNSAAPANVCGGSTPPTATGSVSPNPVAAGNSVSLSATTTPGTNPPSITLTVTCDLTLIGGGTGVVLPTSYTVPAATTPNSYALPCTVTDQVPRSSSFTISVTVTTTPPALRLIYEITGSGTTSPLAGTALVTRGVVTAIRGTTGSTKGFYIESVGADRDSDPNTSEGLLVFIGSSSLPACAVVGNNIQIQGTVSDFVPSAAPAGTVPLTELGSTSNCQVLTTGVLDSLPPAVTIDDTVIATGGLATQARKFLSMRVSVPNAVTVGPSLGNLNETAATATPSGTFFVTVQGVSRPFRGAGILATRRPVDAAPTVPSWNGNPEALRLDTTGLTGGGAFEVATGTTVTGLSGIMDYNTNESQYQVYSNLAGAGTYSPASPVLAATPIPAPLPTDLLVVNANIERFFNDQNDGNGNSVTLTPTAYQGRLSKLSMAIRNVLRMPDIITVEEVEGPSPSDQPLLYPVPQDIVNKVNADAAANGQGVPSYNWCEYPTNDVSQISIAVIYRQDRVTKLDCSQFGAVTSYATPGGGSSLLNDRPPIAFLADVLAPGSDSALRVRIVANHLRSLNGIDEPGTANGDRVRTKRNEQAKYLANLITGNLSGEQATNWNLTDNLLVAGDMNAFDINDGYSDSVNCIAGSPAPANQQYFTAEQLAVTTPCAPIATLALTNLTTADPTQRYSYSFSGTAQRIDHILVNSKLNSRVRQFAYVRNNADFPEGPTYRNDFNRPERYSDHDGPVVYLKLPVEVTSRTRVNASAVIFNRATGRYNGTVTVTNSGAVALSGPVYVFFNNLPAAVTLPDLPQFGGVPYATINLPSALAPGATSGTAAISFANPSNVRISYTTKTYDKNF